MLVPTAVTQKAAASGGTDCRLKAELRTLVFPPVSNPNSLDLQYLVTNLSGQNYTLPETFLVMRKTQDGILHNDAVDLGFPAQRFFPHGHTVEFSIWVNLGNVFNHAPNEQEKAELQKQLAGTDAYMIFDERHQCDIEFPAHR